MSFELPRFLAVEPGRAEPELGRNGAGFETSSSFSVQKGCLVTINHVRRA